jgi:hypothetical protein
VKPLLLSMSSAAFPNRSASREERDLFGGGPVLGRFWGGVAKMDSRTLRLAVAAMAIGWLPPCLMAAMQSLATGDESLHSFLTDYGVLARSLIAAPLLILGQAVAGPLLGAIVRHFREAGLVSTADVSRYCDIVRSTRRLRDSTIIEVIIAVAGFVLAAMFWTVPAPLLPAWHHAGSGAPSAASWWHEFVSLPILSLLLLGWLWRLGLWTRFLWKVSRLDLLLIPSHPDGAAGLRFIGLSLEALVLPAFALSSVIAGPLANRVVHGGAQIATFRAPVLAFTALLLVLLAGPLLLFTDKLLAAMQQGILAYGAMARDLGLRLEQRWLGKPVRDDALDANDFSAATDLYSIVSNVHAMNILPLGLRNLAAIVIATLLPFLPVVLLAMSPLALFKKLSEFIL